MRQLRIQKNHVHGQKKTIVDKEIHIEHGVQGDKREIEYFLVLQIAGTNLLIYLRSHIQLGSLKIACEIGVFLDCLLPF